MAMGRWLAVFLVARIHGESEQTCRDEHDQCTFWASQGECSANPQYMRVHCGLSCESCTVDVGDAPKWTGGCFDRDTMCGDWASQGECESNPKRVLPAPKSRRVSRERAATSSIGGCT